MMLLVELLMLVPVMAGIVLAHPDENLSIVELTKKHKYPVEMHSFETKDGYILKSYRIPHGVESKEVKHVVLLAHGMGGFGENYVGIGPPDALAFYLADRGYDVWLFNARGTVHSRKHRSLNPMWDRKKFWNFSWHEIGVYDLSATIDYILNKTNSEKLFYVGHSQGTTILFVMLSELPEFNDKISAGALLAPAVHLQYTQSPLIMILTRFLRLLQRFSLLLSWYEVPIPNSPMINGILQELCSSQSLKDVCLDVVYLFGGPESGLVNKTLLPLILQYGLSGFAVKQLWHYGQVISSGEFKKFDYGKRKNKKVYNDTNPPLYKLTNSKIPLLLFYALQDSFSNPKMVEELTKSLPNVLLKYQVPIDEWNHMDYILAYNVKEIIYDKVFEVFSQVHK